ncbi:hypothetical protein XENORESO_004294 [Xenotaenia resolanae]|uniref:Uncharacterized protein n=1 Tax=Xenotaenia resolanae TaxID=208358 RepID=A0ABV0WZ84_9TELE
MDKLFVCGLCWVKKALQTRCVPQHLDLTQGPKKKKKRLKNLTCPLSVSALILSFLSSVSFLALQNKLFLPLLLCLPFLLHYSFCLSSPHFILLVYTGILFLFIQ